MYLHFTLTQSKDNGKDMNILTENIFVMVTLGKVLLLQSYRKMFMGILLTYLHFTCQKSKVQSQVHVYFTANILEMVADRENFTIANQ